MKITITAAHIAAASPMPNSSPIALALREMGHKDATATHRYAYFDQQVYPLPEIAIAAESRFDFLARQGHIQGEIIEQIQEYSFELN